MSINDVDFSERNKLVNAPRINNISIKFDSIGGVKEIAQILITLPGVAELIINNIKTPVFVYYNKNPIYNKGKWLPPIKNSVSNTISDLLRKMKISKKNP